MIGGGKQVDITKKVKMLLVEFGLNVTQTAKMIETSQPNLSKKLNNNSLSIADLEKIAEGVGAELEVNFVLKDGRKI